MLLVLVLVLLAGLETLCMQHTSNVNRVVKSQQKRRLRTGLPSTWCCWVRFLQQRTTEETLKAK
jgi:hypothetical protein